MDFSDYKFLLNTAYRGWQQCHDKYQALADQIAAGASIHGGRIAAARADEDRALSDFMSMNLQADAPEETIMIRQFSDFMSSPLQASRSATIRM